MNAARHCLVALVFVAAVGGGGRAAAASPEDAERLFREGRTAMSEENYEAARSYFQQSYELDRALGTLLNLAVCEEKLGKLRTALAHLQEALGVADAADPRRPLIAQRISRLDARLPRVTIQPDEAIAATVTISLDSQPLGPEELRKTIRIDPGTHVLECSGPSGERCTKVFQVSEGKESVESLTLTLLTTPLRLPPSSEKPSAPVVDPQSPPTVPRPAGDRRSLAYAIGGFSLATVVVGLIAGVGVMRQQAIVEAHCKEKECDADGVNAADTGRTLSAISTVTTALGVAGIGVSAYILISTPSTGSTTTGFSMAGRF